MAPRGSGDPRRRGRVSATAEQKRVDRRRKRADRRRRSLAEWFGSIRPLDVAVFAITMALSIFAWISFVLEGGSENDLGAAPVVIGAIAAAGSYVLVVNFAIQTRTRRPGYTTLGFPLVLAPVVLVPLVTLAITPPSTPTPGYLDWVNIYGVILITGLGILGGLLSGLLLYLLVVWPVLLILDAVRPQPAPGDTTLPEGYSGYASKLSRGQLAVLAGILVSAVAFAIAMTGVDDSASGSTRQRMRDTFFAWITFHGEPVPSAIALAFAIVIAVLVWVSYRVSRTPVLPETRPKRDR